MARKIKAVEYSNEYNLARRGSLELAENRDCAVVAASVVTGVPYAEVHRIMAEEGREKGRGTFIQITERTLRRLGYKMKGVLPGDFIERYPGVHKNLRNVTSHHPRRFNEVWADGKTYLFQSSGHIWAVVNGQNHDWSVNRALRVLWIYEVVKIES